MKKLLISLLILPFTIQAQTWNIVGSADFSLGAAYSTSLVIDSNGTPYVAYSDSINNQKATVMKFNGSSWVTVGSAGFSDSIVEGGEKWIAINGRDTPYVAFRDFGNSYEATVMKYNGSSWVIVDAGLSLGAASGVTIAIGGGNFYVPYSDAVLSGKATVMHSTSSVFSGLGPSGFSSNAAYYPSIAVGTPPDVFVAYEDGAGGKATVMQYNGSSWVNVYPTDFSVGIAQYTQIAIDGSGNIYVAYMDNANDDKVTVMEHGYGTFGWATVGSAGFSAGASDYISLALDGSGTPYVAYRDNGNGEKATVMKFNGSSWVTVGSAGFSAGMAVCTSLAIDGTGTPYVVYMDAANGNKATVMKFSNAPITGISTLCAGDTTTLHDTTIGGAWSSSNTSIATIGTGTGFLTGIAGGTTTISYTKYGISSIYTITINPLPSAGAIAGVSSVCVGSSITLTDTVTGGTWSSSSTSLATIGTGMVTGISAGLDTIKYTFTNFCGTATTTKTITIDPLPSGITGTTNVCAGLTITLDDISIGGVWSSSSTSIAAIGTSGVVTGVLSGTTIITYSLPTGCTTTKIITVNPLPVAGAITGLTSVCVGSDITLSDVIIGGNWNASNINAFVSSAGIVLGFTTGIDTIIYSVTNVCGTDTAIKIITVNPLAVAGTITGADTVCVGDTISLIDAVTGGSWITSNGNAFVSSTGVVYGITAGIDNISYSVTNSCGTASVDTMINILNCTTEIKKISNQLTPAIIIFPNPNKGFFTINISTKNNEDAQIIITNILGEKVKELTIPTNIETDVQLQSPAGIYFISAVTKNESVTEKIIIE